MAPLLLCAELLPDLPAERNPTRNPNVPPPSPAAAPAAPAAPAKSKKRLVIVLAVVLVLLAAGGGAAAWFVYQRSHAALDDDAEAAAPAEPAVPPTYLPLDNMVVNLADPGGDRFAQIGITLELSDAKASDQVKQYLPTIRNAILMLISQRTSEDLLRREGKEALAEDIRREVSRPLGYAVPEKGASAARDGHGSADSPVRRVLFSSFIIQ